MSFILLVIIMFIFGLIFILYVFFFIFFKWMEGLISSECILVGNFNLCLGSFKIDNWSIVLRNDIYLFVYLSLFFVFKI